MARIAFALPLVLALVLTAATSGGDTADTFGYRATLTARAEVPRPTAPVGAGGLLTATVTKNGSTYAITWRLTYRRLSGPAVAAHVHRGRPGVGTAASPASPCRRRRAAHLATLTGCTPKKSATWTWDHPSSSFVTAIRRRASSSEAVPLLRMPMQLPQSRDRE